MKYENKSKRLLALIETYRRVHFVGKTIDMKRVAEWVKGQGLFPVPETDDPDETCEAWEKKLGEVMLDWALEQTRSGT